MSETPGHDAPESALQEVLEVIKDNPQAREALTRLARNVLSVLEKPSQNLQKVVDNSSNLTCDLCGSKDGVTLYDREDIGIDLKKPTLASSRSWAACASCAALVKSASLDRSVESSLMALFQAHPQLPDTETNRNRIRQFILQSHNEVRRLEKQRNGLDGNGVEPQGLPALPRPQEPRLIHRPSSATSINDCQQVLVIGNHASLTQMLKARFEHNGFVVRTACDWENGFAVYTHSGPFRLVIIDLCINPRSPQNGIGLARTIRQVQPMQNIVITAFAYQSAEEVQEHVEQVLQVPLTQELIDVPVLTDMGELNVELDRLRNWANKADVSQAIQMLSHADLLRIKRYATVLAWGAAGWTGEDLLQRAVVQTLMGAEDPHNGKRKGRRRWDKSIDFARHLAGAIESIAYHWKEKSYQSCTISERFSCDDEQELSRFENVDSGETSVLESLIKEEEEARKRVKILERFRDDPKATAVLQGLFSGMDKDEILLKESLTDEEYKAISRRIRRTLDPGDNGR